MGLRVVSVAAAVAVVVGVATTLGSSVRPASASSDARVIVRERQPTSTAAELLVRRLGGTVGRELPIIGGFSARLPQSSLTQLRAARAVVAVTPDAPVRAADAEPNDLASYDALPPTVAWHALIGLPDPPAGHDGAGVTVALLDTGVASTDDLGSRVLERVDLTSEGDGLDRYGHGTHMAGLIAGDGTEGGLWTGAAPAADLVSVKVAGADGSTDVSTVLAGLQWVGANEQRLGIRVLNLSFGTDSTQSAAVDPLDFAVEQLWQSGILVVAAAGNEGPDASTVAKPGDDPFVLTVGAGDATGGLAPFSGRGPTVDGYAKPDVIGPGTSIVSIRVPDSTIDLARPAARVGEGYFKGTGTSQATAIVSGVAALLFQANPDLTPDQAKAVLVDSATPLTGGGAGAGLVDVARGLDEALAPPASANVGLTASTGLGLLEASRGSFHVVADPLGSGTTAPVVGEVDVLGRPWDAKTWSAGFWSSTSWDPVRWAAATVAGWDAKTWSAKTWSASSWN